jgi:hypothetical protein
MPALLRHQERSPIHARGAASQLSGSQPSTTAVRGTQVRRAGAPMGVFVGLGEPAGGGGAGGGDFCGQELGVGWWMRVLVLVLDLGVGCWSSWCGSGGSGVFELSEREGGLPDSRP